jgi:hypothetical protein
MATCIVGFSELDGLLKVGIENVDNLVNMALTSQSS